MSAPVWDIDFKFSTRYRFLGFSMFIATFGRVTNGCIIVGQAAPGVERSPSWLRGRRASRLPSRL